MALEKLSLETHDPILARAPYFEMAPAKIAHVNEAIRRIKEATAEVTDITSTNLTAIGGTFANLAAAQTAVATLKTETEARLDAIEAKLNELIAALS